MLEGRVACWKEEAFASSVSPANDVRRVVVRAPDLHHFTIAIGFTRVMALDDDPIPDARVHVGLLCVTVIVRAVDGSVTGSKVGSRSGRDLRHE